jgi:Spy/CpxP family protein refolding chaperone
MKKVAVMVAIVSIISLAALAYGQMGGPGMGSGMMGGCGMGGPGMGSGMMGGCGMGGDRMMGGEHPMWRHLMSLNLDEQQKNALREIKSRMMKETIKSMADAKIVQIELMDLLSKEPVDMKAVEAKLNQLEKLRTEMHLSHIKAMEEMKAKLTPEQRKKFREMMEAGPMMGGMGKMHDEGCCNEKE